MYYCRHRVTNSRNKQINVCQRGDWSRHKLDCVPVAEQGAIDPNEELLRAAAPDQFKVNIMLRRRCRSPTRLSC